MPAVPALVIWLENRDTHNAALVAQDEKLHQLPAGHASKLYAHDGAHQSAVEALDIVLRQEIARLHSRHDGLSEAQVSMLEELEAKLRDEMLSQDAQLDVHLGAHQVALQAMDDKLNTALGWSLHFVHGCHLEAWLHLEAFIAELSERYAHEARFELAAKDPASWLQCHDDEGVFYRGRLAAVCLSSSRLLLLLLLLLLHAHL